MLKQSLEMESSQMNKRMGEATNQRAGTEEAKHMAAEELTETEASLKTDTAYLADLKQSCAAKATEWSERPAGRFVSVRSDDLSNRSKLTELDSAYRGDLGIR